MPLLTGHCDQQVPGKVEPETTTISTDGAIGKLKDDVSRIDTRLNEQVQRQRRIEDHIGRSSIVSIILLAIISVLQIYLVFKIRKSEAGSRNRFEILKKKFYEITLSMLSKQYLRDNIAILQSDIAARITNLKEEFPQPSTSHREHNSNIGSKSRVMQSGTQELTGPGGADERKIPVKYDAEKQVFVISSNSKLFYIDLSSGSAELKLEDRMKDNTDISVQNQFALHFDIIQASDSNLSNGYHVIEPATISWDPITKAGTREKKGKIMRNSA